MKFTHKVMRKSGAEGHIAVPRSGPGTRGIHGWDLRAEFCRDTETLFDSADGVTSLGHRYVRFESLEIPTKLLIHLTPLSELVNLDVSDLLE